jgi:hypothetical protein
MRSRLAAALVACAALVGCRHAIAPQAPLPESWVSLRGPAPVFTSLYRLACCGRLGLLAAVRTDAHRLSLDVTVPPGKVVLEAWVENGRGFIHDRDAGCTVPLAGDELPVARQAALPLDLPLLGTLLAGTLPEQARAVAEAPGWVEWEADGLWVRACLSGEPARVVKLRAGRPGEREARLSAELGAHRGPAPSTVELELAGRRASLELLAYHAGATVTAPTWLTEPLCKETR